MFDGLTDMQMWLLIVGVAVAAFVVGRLSTSASPEALERKRIAHEEAARNFKRLQKHTQAEVDALVADRKMVAAIKLIRAELNTGLFEAKQIVDLRKRSVSQR